MEMRWTLARISRVIAARCFTTICVQDGEFTYALCGGGDAKVIYQDATSRDHDMVDYGVGDFESRGAHLFARSVAFI